MRNVFDSLAMFLIAVMLIAFFTFTVVAVLALLEDTARWLRRRA